MTFRKYQLGGYEEMCEQHRWQVPERYNIAFDVCDKHDRGRLAMVWEDWRGDERRVSFGELQDLSCKFANVLRANGVEREDRVATLLPSLPETAAIFLGTYRAGAILLSMSVLYGDEGIEHRLRDSGAKVVVTDSANRDRIPDGLAEQVLVLDDGLLEDMAGASTSFETVDTAASATAATRPGSVIVSPAVPSEMANVVAIGISNPIGRISAVTMTKMPIMTETTPSHDLSDVRDSTL